MQPVMKILVGLPGSGKSHYAMKTAKTEPGNWFRINWDSMRGENYVYSRQAEEEIKVRSENLVRELVLGAQSDIIIDNTNLNAKTRARWERLAAELNMKVESLYFSTPINECIRRDALRTGRARVGRAVIERMALFAGCLPFLPTDKKLVLVDMDGTLADLSHRLHYVRKLDCAFCLGAGMERRGQLIGDKMQYFYSPVKKCSYCNGSGKQKKDWPSFFRTVLDDKPIPTIVNWVRAIAADPDFMVCIVSGRPIDQCGEATVAWLEEHGVPFHRIFMRNSGDKRDDTIVKQEILDKLPKSQIAWVIDDRQRVCDMWRANGLTTYQVAEGNF